MFCGGGGSSYGAAAAGAEIVAGVDAWKLAAETFKANFPLAEFTCSRLTRRASMKSTMALGKIELILASPECTNHTCAKGNATRDEESKASARYVLSYAKQLNPRWIILENVIYMKNWAGYPKLLRELSKYYFVREEILDESNFGVPQSRKRLYLICDNKIPPKPILYSKVKTKATVLDILDPPGMWNARSLYREGRASATLRRASNAIGRLGEGVPFLLVYYGSDGGGGWQPLDRPLRTLTTLDRFGLVEWDTAGPTLRMLQVSELRRAMGFDNKFKLPVGSRRDHIKLLGNAVCPPVMEQIVRSLAYPSDLIGSLAAE